MTQCIAYIDICPYHKIIHCTLNKAHIFPKKTLTYVLSLISTSQWIDTLSSAVWLKTCNFVVVYHRHRLCYHLKITSFFGTTDESLKLGGRVWTYCFLALWWVSTEFWFCWTGVDGDDTISYFTTLSWCWWWKRYDNDDDYDVMMFQYHISPWSATASLELPAKYNSIKNVKWSQTLFFRLNNWREMHLRLSKSLTEICHSKHVLWFGGLWHHSSPL